MQLSAMQRIEKIRPTTLQYEIHYLNKTLLNYKTANLPQT
jgi:hypothetical protein